MEVLLLILTTDNERLIYIDIARAIAILAVVVGHINQFYRDSFGLSHPVILAFIYTFHMPLFFIISGILFSENTFKNKSFMTFLIGILKSLLIPYLFLDITGGLYYVARGTTTIKKILINTITLHPNIGPDWFISALFIGEIILYFVLRYYRPFFKIIAWIPFLLIYIYYPITTHYLNVIIRGIIAFTFMFAGYKLKDYFKSDINKRWDVIILSFILTYVISIFNGQTDIWSSMIGNPFLFFVGGLSGAYWIIGLSKNLNSKLLIFIGQNTITMMGTHSILISLVWELLTSTVFKMLDWSANVYGAILLFVLVIAANLPIMYLYNRFLPFCIGRFPKKKEQNS